mmetsp:Transcript_55461/g.109960  ORF Transcript_55461/g.109960 Transcript_55461/m.109960 type:complete len:336 (+) Transcript_55461:64-1071(+)
MSAGVLPLTDFAVEAVEDKFVAPARLVMSGRPFTSPVTPTYLKAKYQVGSNTGPRNFQRKQTVFHKDYIPEAKLSNVAAVNAWKKERSNKCGVPERWNTSVLKPDILCVKRSRENNDHDRSHMYEYNFRSEVLPPKNLPHIPPQSKWVVDGTSAELKAAVETAKAGSRLYSGSFKRTEEMPVNPKLNGLQAWRPESRANKQELLGLARKEATLASRSSERGKQALGAPGGAGYATPEQRYSDFRRQVRVLKSAGLTEGYAATVEAKEAIPKHNRLAKEASRKTRSFEHSGVFEREKQGEGDMWMWSDTGSFEKTGPGDVVKTQDPLAYNLTGVNG